MENQRGGNVRTAWFAIAGFKNKRRGRGRGLSKASRSCKRQENEFSSEVSKKECSYTSTLILDF